MRRCMQVIGAILALIGMYIILCYIDMIVPVHLLIPVIIKPSLQFKVLGILGGIIILDIGFSIMLYFRN